MRDVKQLSGPKRYYADLDVAARQILAAHPGARAHGSVGAWHWAVGDEVVAEAWLHATRPGWWVRVRSKSN